MVWRTTVFATSPQIAKANDAQLSVVELQPFERLRIVLCHAIRVVIDNSMLRFVPGTPLSPTLLFLAAWCF